MRILDLLYVVSDKNCDFIISVNNIYRGFYSLGEIALDDETNNLIIRNLKSKTHNLHTTYIINCEV